MWEKLVIKKLLKAKNPERRENFFDWRFEMHEKNIPLEVEEFFTMSIRVVIGNIYICSMNQYTLLNNLSWQ
jgi:hypothetical protein